MELFFNGLLTFGWWFFLLTLSLRFVCGGLLSSLLILNLAYIVLCYPSKFLKVCIGKITDTEKASDAITQKISEGCHFEITLIKRLFSYLFSIFPNIFL